MPERWLLPRFRPPRIPCGCNGRTVILCLLLFAGGDFNFRAEAAEPRLRDQIDRHIQAKWKEQGIEPAAPADDAEFLRRITLDLTGTIPAYEETAAFLEKTAPDRREQLIDRLLDSPEYVEQQVDRWDMILFGRNPPGYQTNQRDGFQSWLRRKFAANEPLDRFVRELLRAEGDSVDQGPPLYLAQYSNQPEDAMEVVTQTFLGIQLQCARCHDHPFDKWTQTDFYGMAAFLARLNVVNAGKKERLTRFAIGEKNTGEILFTGPASEQVAGQKGVPVGPKFLLEEPLEEPALPEGVEDPRNFPSGKMPPAPHFSRKNALADWIASPDNPYFARAMANRVWAQFMGRGLVHPVDNMSESNPASHPELLDLLTRELVAHQFDLKWLIRELVSSQTWQLSSRGTVSLARPQWFEQARVRPLTAEELTAAWKVATGYNEVLKRNPPAKPSENRFHPLTGGYVISFLGNPEDGTGEFQGGLREHLFLSNGGIDALLTTADGSLHHALLQSEQSWPERIDRLFLQTLGRRPDDQERDQLTEFLADQPDLNARLNDAIWALLTCSEFRFSH